MNNKGLSPYQVALVIVGGFFALILLSWSLGFISLGMRTATGVAERTLNPDNVIANYEWFVEANDDFIALGNQIDVATANRDNFADMVGTRTKWTFEDKNEYARLNAVVLGLQNRQLSLAAEYNARSSMLNRNIFKQKNLPTELEVNE